MLGCRVSNAYVPHRLLICVWFSPAPTHLGWAGASKPGAPCWVNPAPCKPCLERDARLGPEQRPPPPLPLPLLLQPQPLEGAGRLPGAAAGGSIVTGLAAGGAEGTQASSPVGTFACGGGFDLSWAYCHLLKYSAVCPWRQLVRSPASGVDFTWIICSSNCSHCVTWPVFFHLEPTRGRSWDHRESANLAPH